VKKFRFRLEQVMRVRRVQEDQARGELLLANRAAQLAAQRIDLIGLEHQGIRRLRRSAPELEPLSEALAHIVAAERISRHDTGPLLLTAYHLIPRGKARAYRGILKRRAAALGLRAIASGPWPPYAFVPELGPAPLP